MAKPSSRKVEPTVEPVVKELAGPRVVSGIWFLSVVTLCLSVVAMLKPEWRLWAVHQFAFLQVAIALPLLLIAAFLLSPFGVRRVATFNFSLIKLPPLGWAAIAFVLFMLLSVSGSLLGDGQLSITRLAHVGDMLESNKHIPPGRFFAQKEPGTMLLHEGAFRIGMAAVGPDMHVAPGRAGQDVRVERQLIYRGIAQWCFRILSSLAGALVVYMLIRFTRVRKQLSQSIFWLVILTSGGWLLYFGYVENYAWVTLAMLMFIMAGIKATEPPRTIPILPILLFGLACFMHFMAIVLLPALIFLLWTMHHEQKDVEANLFSAPVRRAKLLTATFICVGIAGYIYVKGWKGWVSVMPLLPKWVDDGYALLSLNHGVDLLNLFLWGAGAAIIGLLLTRRVHKSVRENNQENFLLLAAGGSAFFAVVFSPNLGMARDWDIVTAALMPTVFYGAWKLSKLDYDTKQLPKLQASLAALIVLLLVPAVLVQTVESTAIARFRSLLELDRSRSAYGWENLALYYQKTKELDKRIGAWQEAVAVERNPRYLFNLAEALKLAGRIDEADTTALAAARLDKEYANNLFYYAVAQAKRGRVDRTKILVDTAVEIDSTLEYAQRMQTWAETAVHVDSIAQSGDVAKAREMVEKLIKVDSTNSFWRDYALTLGK